MSIVDAKSFDGSRSDPELSASSKAKYKRTSLSLIAMSQGCFVVVTGIDKENKPFSDSDIAKIFSTFDKIVDDNPNDDPKQLRKKVEAELASMWTPCPESKKCPFNLKVKYSTRLAFHLHIPGWEFEEAKLKLKTLSKPGEFSDLQWMVLNGQSQKPNSFSITDQDTEKKTYEYALYILAQQSDGSGSTRIIIDPDTENTGLGP